MSENEGLPLERAALSFANADVAERVKKALGAIEASDVEKWWVLRPGQTFVEKMNRMTLEISKKHEFDAALSLARSNLAEALRLGLLHATGIRTRPAVETIPSAIPSFIFDKSLIDWDRDVVENAGTRFELVRIFQDLPERVAATTKMGRPSSKDAIDRILKQMAEGGRSIGVHQQRVCEDVRAQAKQADVDISRGFSDPVIKARIRRVLIFLGGNKAK